jgi:hypothetical protein
MGIFVFLLALLDVSNSHQRPKLIWIAEQGAGRVYALDVSGKEVWAKDGLTRVREVYPTTKGTVLVGTLEGKVYEFSKAGKTLWEHQARNQVYAVRRLPNGNLLVAEYEAIVEIDRNHTIVWEYRGGSCPENIELLPNGNVLIAWYGSGKVEEVDRDKKAVWTHAMQSPMTAQRLAGGDTLICDIQGNLSIVNREGKSVWSHQPNRATPFAFAADSGDILYSTWTEAVRIGRDGRVKWTRRNLNLAIKIREQ